MLNLNALSSNQKAQLRNAFTLIDGESRDANITKDDLEQLYSTLGLEKPSYDELKSMLTIDGEDKSESGINFAQFSTIMAKELSKIEDRSIIYNALKTFQDNEQIDSPKNDLQIDLDILKEACCSVQLGEIGSGDHRLSRTTFDSLTQGFIQEQIDGKQMFLASKWIDAYID
ncbi:MLC2 [[Candida] subhashii]|uniref:MLC2 n=1 Tax=[Candida] subhashii TaxID=561895 RepID=A0A8J5Q2N9_9ASCO|nr:MLC2 [[Candida] subhashii]KAG7660914.1 MLC2 [[Candida] subhashii]